MKAVLRNLLVMSIFLLGGGSLCSSSADRARKGDRLGRTTS